MIQEHKSTYGVKYEWELHNIAYYSKLGGDSAKHLDVGKSIFSDGQTHPIIDDKGNFSSAGMMSLIMRVSYFLVANPFYWVWDLIANGGF